MCDLNPIYDLLAAEHIRDLQRQTDAANAVRRYNREPAIWQRLAGSIGAMLVATGTRLERISQPDAAISFER